MMEQIYHYTRHNSVNQAAAAYSTAPENRRLLRFVYKHALEELGHEQMVVHDLKSINLYNEGFENLRPLPATQALISYLYKVALDKGAVARLGYSYWAENCYGHIDPLLRKFSNDLNLTKNNMSFFVAHSEIDSKHSDEVNEAISFSELTKDEEEEIINTDVTTLYLTGQILEQVAHEYSLTSAKHKEPIII
ncbi:iron-containing redox enzyme family protein [Xylella fastidiosa]|nr:iron-containing redox enzyme family protein [Xylella fastidiosa]